MKFGIGLNPQNNIGHITKLSQIVEDAGFKYLWLCDYPNIEIYPYLKSIAENTETIKFGHGVTNSYIKSPLTILTEIEDINELSDKRAILGLSVGSKQIADEMGITWDNPIDELKQTIGEISKNCDTPIYVEALSKNLVEKLNENIEGFLVPASNPKDFKKLIPDNNKLDIGAYTATSIGYDEKVTKNASKLVVAFIIAGSSPDVLKRHDTSPETCSKIKISLAKGAINTAVKYIDDDLLNEYSVTGTPYDVIEKINELERVGVGQFIVSYPIGQNPEESLKLFKDVISTY